MASGSWRDKVSPQVMKAMFEGVQPCPAGQDYTAVVFTIGSGAYGEHDGQRCRHGVHPLVADPPRPLSEPEARRAAQALDARHLNEVPFPKTELKPGVCTTDVRLTFGDQQDAALFHRWIVKGGGWAAFGTYVDERRG